MTTPAVEISGLVKAFGSVRALDGLDLTVPVGGVYGFLGPNGAGKTTTIRILATLLQPDGGVARVYGRDVTRNAHDVRRDVSITGQFASIDADLTARENVVILGRLLGLGRQGAKRRAAELLESFGLTSAADMVVKTLSGGTRRRLDIASSIVVAPRLLFLDEPTTGLDPRSRVQVWDTIRALVVDGTTVLLTTQYLDEADQLAHRVAVIDHGRVVAEGTTTELKARTGAGRLMIRLGDTAQLRTALGVLADRVDTNCEADPRVVRAHLPRSADATSALHALAEAGVTVAEFSFGQPTLDEVFLAITGHGVTPDDTANGEAA